MQTATRLTREPKRTSADVHGIVCLSMTECPSIRVAVVGAAPDGFYTAGQPLAIDGRQPLTPLLLAERTATDSS
jgi:hypothetical protein